MSKMESTPPYYCDVKIKIDVKFINIKERNGKMTYTMDPVHEGYISQSEKKIGVIKNEIWQFPFKNTEEVIKKTNRYSTLGAEKLKNAGKTGGIFKAFLHGLWSFIKHYFFKLGFLDGGAGFVIAFGNFEGTFYRYIKLSEEEYQSIVNYDKPEDDKQSKWYGSTLSTILKQANELAIIEEKESNDE